MNIYFIDEVQRVQEIELELQDKGRVGIRFFLVFKFSLLEIFFFLIFSDFKEGLVMRCVVIYKLRFIFNFLILVNVLDFGVRVECELCFFGVEGGWVGE